MARFLLVHRNVFSLGCLKWSAFARHRTIPGVHSFQYDLLFPLVGNVLLGFSLCFAVSFGVPPCLYPGSFWFLGGCSVVPLVYETGDRLLEVVVGEVVLVS